jgi:hypothetical protein
MNPRRVRRPRSALLALAAVAGAIALPGCAAIGIEENTFETTPLPAISDDNAASVLSGIDTTVNQANSARDPELLATVFAHPLLDIDVAGYALDATADPDNAEPLPEVDHTDPTAFVPRFEDYPQWFMAASTVRPDAPVRLEVLARESAAAPWITSISTDLLAGVQFPKLALDDAGYVVPVTASEQKQLPSTPADLAAAQAAGLSGTADPSSDGPSFTEDTWTTDRLAADAARGTTVADAATVKVAYEVTDVLPQALKTADGGTLVFYALAEDVVYTVAPTFFLQLDEATAALVGTAQVSTSLTERWGLQLAVYLPPQATGAARVLAARVDRIALSGS